MQNSLKVEGFRIGNVTGKPAVFITVFRARKLVDAEMLPSFLHFTDSAISQ